MAEIFANSGGNEANLSVPSPILQGNFIPSIDIPDAQDGFGLVIPLGGGNTTRRYGEYGVSAEVSNRNTQLNDLSRTMFGGFGGQSYKFEGLIGPQGIQGPRGLPGLTGLIGFPASYGVQPVNSNFLTELPYNIDSINDLGTAADKLIYTSAYTPHRNDNWVERQPTGAEDMDWQAIAANSDGSVIIAAGKTLSGNIGKVYLSTDSGVTFNDTNLGGDATYFYYDVASDSDGSHLLAVSGKDIQLSINSGSSWSDVTPPAAAGSYFACGAMDAGGSNLIVGEHNGRLWTSSDYGANWTERRYDGDRDRDYFAVASNSDGTQLIATDYYETSNPGLWISTDSGANWTDRTPGGAYSQLWQRIAMDDDGSHILAINYDPTKRRVFLSEDNGATWVEVDHPDASGFKDYWSDVALDSDGSHLMMSNTTTGRIYTSLDGGTTWERPAPSGLGTLNWIRVATVSDGSIWLAISFNSTHRIYQSSFVISYNRATWAESALTSAGRAILDDADAATQATTLGLGTGDAVTHDTLTLSSIAHEGSDVDKFLVDSTGVIKYRTGAEVLSDIGGSGSGHLHDAATLEHDGVNSDGGAFGFNTTGLVTFNQSIAAANYAAANLLTAAATNAGEVDFTAASKKLDVEGNAIVDQDYSSDASPTFTGLTLSGLTLGSVTFAGASGVISQDNSNLFWDDTSKRLGIGVNTGFDPRTGITVSGDVDILHTAIDTDDHAFELDIDAAGFGDVKAIDIVYVSGDIGAGDDEEAILVNVDESDSDGGGNIAALEVLTTAVGDATIFGLEVGINVIPIEQLSGTFGNMAKAENDGVNALTEFTTSDPGDTNNIEIFVANGDTVLIGNTAKFEEIEFIFETFSNPSVKPTFEFSTGGTSFSSFTPADGTNGMRNNGVVLWLDSDIPSWATNTGGNYEIRITRTKGGNLAATPKEDLIQIGTATEYVWDKAGDVNIHDLTISTPSNIYALSHDSFADVHQDVNTTAAPTLAGLNITAVGSLPGTVVVGKIIILDTDDNLYLGNPGI